MSEKSDAIVTVGSSTERRLRASTSDEPRQKDPTADAYRKVALRLIPLLFLCYLAAYLDRVNISFAKQQMENELGLSGFAYGLGAGIFFIGYFLFELPSNLLAERIGARRTLLRIMLLWGVTSSLMMFAHEEWIFYTLRFLLGAFEAGFVPGVILFLSKWTPSSLRARFMGLFLTATAVAGLVGAPLSGWILSYFDEVAGLSGWQWMFLIQGVPSVILGVVVFYTLPDTPRQARWLTGEELAAVERAIAADPEAACARHTRLAAALRDWRIYAFSLAYFCIAGGVFLVTFWLPTALAQYQLSSPELLGWLTAVPYLGAVAAMVVLSRLSDRTGERRLFCVIPLLVGALALAGTMYSASLVLTIALFTIAAAAIWGVFAVFWSVPPMFYHGVAAAGAIAVINSIGNLNGFVNPFIVGALQSATGALTSGMFITVAGLVVGAIVLTFTIRRPTPLEYLRDHQPADLISDEVIDTPQESQ